VLVRVLLQFAQRTRNVELGPAKKMIFFRNMEETVRAACLPSAC
jgi:hypothetical protein